MGDHLSIEALLAALGGQAAVVLDRDSHVVSEYGSRKVVVRAMAAGVGLLDGERDLITCDGRTLEITMCAHGPHLRLLCARDVTDAERSRVELESARERYRLLAEGISDLLMIFSPLGQIAYVSPSVVAACGWKQQELEGRYLLDFAHADDREMIAALLDRAVTDGTEVRFEWRLRRFDGQVRWVETSAWCLFGNDGHREVHSTSRDITERRETEQRLAYEANHDPLTGLWNRRRFEAEGLTQMARCERYGEHAALLILDLDKFKPVNDEHGHDEGDKALKAIADGLKEALRSTDHPCRMGGDEFAVLASHVDAVTLAELAERLRHAVAVAGAPWQITASVGAAALNPSATFAQNVKRADVVAYDAKRSGGDCARMDLGPVR